MEDIIRNLVKIAEDFDSLGEKELADKIDAIANGVLDVKTAQYLGLQGYWVRNERCWGNCYRTKRKDNPGLPTQEVWANCHREYVDAMEGNNVDKWDKYAGSDSKIVVADARKSADKYFSDNINERVASGEDISTAVIASLRDASGSNFDKLIDCSNDLMTISNNVKSFDMSLRLATASADISKVAQWWNPADWAAKGVGGLQDVGRGVGDWSAKKRQQGIDKGQAKLDAQQKKLQDKRMKERARGYPGAGQPLVSPPGVDLTGDPLPGTAGGPPVADETQAQPQPQAPLPIPVGGPGRFQSGTGSVVQQPGQSTMTPEGKAGPTPATDQTVDQTDANQNGVPDAVERRFQEQEEIKTKYIANLVRNKEKLSDFEERLWGIYGKNEVQRLSRKMMKGKEDSGSGKGGTTDVSEDVGGSEQRVA